MGKVYIGNEEVSPLLVRGGTTDGLTKAQADELYVSKDESGAAMFDMITRAQGQITVPDKPGTLALLSDLEGLSGGGGVIIPSQENNSGKFLTTDGDNLSWGNALKNNASDSDGSIAIGGGTTCEAGGVCIGAGSDCRSGVAIGNYAYSTASEAIAIGLGANATAKNAIQLGFGTNNEENTFSVGLNYINYTILKSNGIIPSERLASDGATGQVLTKTASGMEWTTISSGDVSKEELSSKIPAMPTSDGVYTLYCTVTNGVPVCEWKTVG